MWVGVDETVLAADSQGIIAGMMRQHFSFNNNEGLSFFNGYGDQTMPMWEAFKVTLNANAKTIEDENEIVDAANQTFIKFGDWIAK